MIAAGVVLALGLALLDRTLEQRGSAWRTPIMPVAIGLYLPFGLSVAILLGALVRQLFPANEGESDRGILFARAFALAGTAA